MPSVAKPRVVLAYSGGAASSAAMRWLRDRHDADVVTVTLDLGQGPELEAARAKAIADGAIRAHVLDLREVFARDYVVPALQAGVQDPQGDPLADALAYPLIAASLLEIAAMEQATGVAHGAQRRQPQLDSLIRSLSPGMVVFTPDDGASRVPAGSPTAVSANAETDPRWDTNLWGRTLLALDRGAPAAEPSHVTPREAAYITVLFDRGVPVGINDVVMPFVELVASLATLAAAHGLGRLEIPANPPSGDPHRLVDSPAALVLHAAHRELQSFVAPPGLDDVCGVVSAAYIDVVRKGLWFTPLREALAALVAKVQERVTGSVRLQFAAGACHVVGLTSPFGPDDSAGSTSKPNDTSSLVTQ